jgi:3-deoxy-D-manno-octulosonate 8-phosphate phosphatase (KDO 8-P phosphatase)
LQKIGAQVAVIAGRKSNMAERRMTILGMQHIHHGCEDKPLALQLIQNKRCITVGETAAIGDDMPSLDVFKVPQYDVCVQDAKPILAAQADYQTLIRGEFDAIREVCGFTLLTHGQLDTIHSVSI